MKLYWHEKRQDRLIYDLQAKVALIEADNDEGDRPAWSEDAFNYLAIGNSITWHPITEFWWNEIGMAASEEDKDYYHIVLSGLRSAKGEVQSHVYNFSVWEVQSHDRGETLDILKGYLDDRIDLVTVQLSENAGDLTTFEVDCIELINYIKDKCPEAQIVIVDDFWSDEKSQIKKLVADDTGVEFADLSEARGDKKYQCGMWTAVSDAEGHEHIVEHDGVASHPGDEGMAYIAERVLELVE